MPHSRTPWPNYCLSFQFQLSFILHQHHLQFYPFQCLQHLLQEKMQPIRLNHNILLVYMRGNYYHTTSCHLGRVANPPNLSRPQITM